MKNFVLVFSAVLLMTGCRREPDEVTFIVVNGRPITASLVKESVLVRHRIAELSGSPIPADKFVDWANGLAMKMVGLLANSELLDQQVAKSGISVTPADVEKALAFYNQSTGQKAKSPEELAPLFGDLAPAFRRQFESSARAAAYDRLYWSFKVTDSLVDGYLADISNAWCRAQGVDADARRKAKVAYTRLRSGEPWEVVAAACSEDRLQNAQNERFAKEWTWVNADARGIRPLATALQTMKTGDFTEPIETPEGLQIVRLVGKDKKIYRLARIFFRMAQPVSMPSSREKARETLAADMRNFRQGKTLETLQKMAVISYPMGTNVTYKIWNDGKERPDK